MVNSLVFNSSLVVNCVKDGSLRLVVTQEDPDIRKQSGLGLNNGGLFWQAGRDWSGGLHLFLSWDPHIPQD